MTIVPQMPQDSIAPPGDQHTLNDLLRYYDREYLAHKAQTTQYQQRRLFVWWRTQMGWRPLTDFTPAFVRAWRDELSTRHAPGTVRRYMASLAAAFRVAVDELAWLPETPFTKARKPPQTPGRVRFLSDEERTRLLAACQGSRNPHLYPLVLLALSTGARKDQLRQLRWRDLDFTRGRIRLGTSKRTRPRSLPLRGPVVALLQHLSQRQLPDAWVFARHDGKAPIFADAAFIVACQRAKVLDFHFHDLRHTAASFLAMSGASLRDIQEVLGHTTAAMSSKYIHLTENHTAAALDRMLQQMFPGSDAPLEGGPHRAG